MLSKLKRVEAEIRRGENLDIYLSIGLALVIGLLGAFQVVSAEIVAAAVLATLGLLSLSTLQNRRNVELMHDATAKLHEEIHLLVTEIRDQPAMSDVLMSGYPDLASEFRHAKSISLLGASHLTTLARYYSEFRHLLKRGGALRFILADQSPEVCTLLAFRGSTTRDPEVIRTTLSNSVARINSLPENPSESGLVQARTIPYVPPFGIVLIERADGSALAVVKLYSFRTPDREHPSFSVSSTDDREWCRFFREQFDKFWENSEVI